MLPLGCSSGDGSDSSESNATGCNVAGVVATPIFQNVALEDVPTALVFSPKGDQVFVTQQLGVIKTFANDQSASASVFVDLRDEVNNGGQREPGINGLVFHPDWPNTAEAYVTYDGFLNGGGFEWRLSRFTSNDGGKTLDRKSETVLIRAAKEAGEHNGGEMKFHPTEKGASGLPLLYISVGDSEDAFGPKGNAQNLQTPLGKFLRIDILDAATRQSKKIEFDAPDDNPFGPNGEFPPKNGVAQGLKAIYSWGHRNPWRFTFDQHDGKVDIWEGEIGQDAFEEVNIVKKAHNYGWNMKEALHTQNFCARQGATQCNQAPLGVCKVSDGDKCDKQRPTLTDPILEVPHPSAVTPNDPLTAKAGGYAIRSLTGGFVYHGKNPKLQALVGKYIYGDFANGKVFAAVPTNGGALSPIAIGSVGQPTSFQLDADGEILVTTFTGTIARLSASGSCPQPPDPNVQSYIFLSKQGIATFQEGLEYLVRANPDIPQISKQFQIPDVSVVPKLQKDFAAFINGGKGPNYSLKDFNDQFMQGDKVSAIYKNDLDLGFWRQMTCTKQIGPGKGGCTVTNWPSTKDPRSGQQLADPTAGDPIEPGISDIFNQDGTPRLDNDNLGTVTMNISPDGFTRFYVFAGPAPHKVQPFAVLDGEGAKVSPALCTPCHSGTFTGDADVGSIFREFEPSALKKHSTKTDDQAEADWFALNQAIKTANQSLQGNALRNLTGGVSQAQAVLNYVDTMYPNGGPPAIASNDAKHIPDSYAQNPAGTSPEFANTKANLFQKLIGPYCMGCHRYNNTNLGSYGFIQGLTAPAGAHIQLEAYILPDPNDPKRLNLAQMPQANYQLFKLLKDPDALNTIEPWLAQVHSPDVPACEVTFNVHTDFNSPNFNPQTDTFHILGVTTVQQGAPQLQKDPLTNWSANLGGITLSQTDSDPQGHFVFTGHASFPQGAHIEFKATVGQDERQNFERNGQGNRTADIPSQDTQVIDFFWQN
jgi:glucose/arabinose dehydrogenase